MSTHPAKPDGSRPPGPTGPPAGPPAGPTDTEARRWLTLAARLALRAAGDVEPNPMVGAVVVRDGRVIGMGHHARFGQAHAERQALDDARARGHDPAGATVYCTLEPCRHHGKQPPCTDALLAARVARVVYASPDPGPVSSGGADLLRAAGVRAELDRSSPLASTLADPFIRRAQTGLPWVITKWAQTIDGRVATRSGQSQWISSEASRRRVHRLRARVCAILTGIGTVHADDPMLTARGVRRVRRVAQRVVVDPDLEIPLGAALVRTAREFPTLVACSKDLVDSGIADPKRAALEAAGVTLLGVPEQTGYPGRLRLDLLLESLASRHGVTNVLVEAGAGLIGSCFDQGLVCEAIVYIAPLLLGDAQAMSAARGRVAESLDRGLGFDLHRVKRIGHDLELTYRARPTGAPQGPGVTIAQ